MSEEHMSDTKPQFTGIIPPLVTPLTQRDTLDVEGAHRLLEHVLSGGVHGLFVLGSTGEAPSLSYRLRREYIEFVCQVVGQRVPVLVGITDTSFVESIAMARCAADAGADAVVLSTPYYFPAGQTELIQYVERMVGELPLPLMLYNMPSLTKVWFETETLARLTHLDRIVGVKDSGGDIEYFARLLELKQQRPDWSIFIGPEHFLLTSLRMGSDGGVSGGANIYPNVFAQCYAAFRAGDLATAEQHMQGIEALQEIYSVGKYASRFIKATKCGLSLRGICDDHMAEPFNHFLQPERARVQAILEQWEQEFAQ